MGSFTCRVGSITAGEADYAVEFPGVGTVLAAIQADDSTRIVAVTNGHASNVTLTVDPDNLAGISLDGGPLIGFGALPSGFNPLTLNVNVRMIVTLPDPPNTGGDKFFLQHEGSNIGLVLTNPAGVETTSSRAVLPVPSALGTFFATNFGLFHDGSGGLGIATGWDVNRIWLSGTYEIEDFTWYLEEIEEEHDGIKFKRNKLTQVNGDDAPPDGAVPAAAPNVDPTFEWWVYDDGDIELWLYQPFSPGTLWVIDTAPTDYGWWKSFEEFLGGALLVVNGNPKKPRTFEEIEDYSDFMGGFPGAGAVYNYKLVYAGKDYDDQPVVRIFDGISDRELARVPAVATVDAIAIISMTAINGQVYLTSLDSGTGDTDWKGRVFRVDVAAANLVQIGAQFTAGEVPYAVAWHNGMLWCGTNPAGDGDEGGKIYYFRPEVDTVWHLDHDLDTEGLGGCTGLASFQGKLIATTTTLLADSAEVLSRAIDGTWTSIATGSGNDALNTYGSPVVFGDTLYVTYFDGTDGAFIYSYDGTTFTEVLESDYSDHAFIGLYLGSGNIYALGGGFELEAIFYGSEDGVTWDDLTDFLPGQATQKATPVFAEVRTA